MPSRTRSKVRRFNAAARRCVYWRAAPIAACLFLAIAGLASPAGANCIAHQPPDAQFVPPSTLQMTWQCVTGGPLYGHAREWFIITFKATNTDQRRVQAMKLQANFVDAFGDVLRTVPIIENARLGTGDADAAVWAFRPTADANSLDHVALYVIAVKYENGSFWRNSGTEPKAGPTPAPRAGLRRFPMTDMNYDMGSVIVPPPSPTPSPTTTP